MAGRRLYKRRLLDARSSASSIERSLLDTSRRASSDHVTCVTCDWSIYKERLGRAKQGAWIVTIYSDCIVYVVVDLGLRIIIDGVDVYRDVFCSSLNYKFIFF